MSAERIAALEAQLAAAQATIATQARALESQAGTIQQRAAAEQALEARRAKDRERKREARRQKLVRDASADLVPGTSVDIPRTIRGHPSFSSPPLDGPPLSSQTQHSPLLYPLPSSSTPPSGLAEPRPPVSHVSTPELLRQLDELEPQLPSLLAAGPLDDLIQLNPSSGLDALVADTHPEDEAAVARLGPNHPTKPESSPPALRLEVQVAPKTARTRKQSAAERLYLQLEETRKARCEERGVAFVAEDWAPARQNTSLGPFAKLEPEAQERFEASWAEYLSDDRAAAKDPPWGIGFFLVSKSTWESKALRGAS